MNSERHFDSDDTRRNCPHGAAVSFPVGTVVHVKVGDLNCALCPCYGGIDEGSLSAEWKRLRTMCCYPDFAPKSVLRTTDSKTMYEGKPSGTTEGDG